MNCFIIFLIIFTVVEVNIFLIFILIDLIQNLLFFIFQIYYLLILSLVIFCKAYCIFNLLNCLILINLRDIKILNLLAATNIFLCTLCLLIIKLIELKILKIFKRVILFKSDNFLFSLLLLLFLIIFRQFFFLRNIKIHILLNPNIVFLIKELLIISNPILFI